MYLVITVQGVTADNHNKSVHFVNCWLRNLKRQRKILENNLEEILTNFIWTQQLDFTEASLTLCDSKDI